MAVNPQRITEVVRAATLQTIHLKQMSADIALPPESIAADSARLKVEYSFSHAYAEQTHTLFSFVACDVSGIIDPDVKAKNPNLVLENDRLFSLQCTFVARYDFSIELTSEECDAFTRTNALFKLYPYLRENVSITFAKMGLPSAVLPLLKVPSIEGKSLSSTAQAAAGS